MNSSPPVVDQLAILSDPIRVRMLSVLEGRELTVSELCDVVQLPQSTVSRHLKTLADGDWVSSRRDGTSRLYTLPLEELDSPAKRLWQVVRELAGDVANFANPALGIRLRVEHEDNANTMGRTAGLNMAGRATAYDHLPFFYSDLFDLGYEAVGELDPRLETVVDWKEPFREGVVYYLKDGRVRGVLLWNTWGQVDHARALIAERGPFRAKDLKGRLPA